MPVLNPLFRAHGIGGHRTCICLMLCFHTFCEVSRVPTERVCHVPGVHSVTSRPVSPGSASRHRRLDGWDSRVTQFSTWLFSSCPSLGGGNESESQLLRGVQDASHASPGEAGEVRLFHPQSAKWRLVEGKPCFYSYIATVTDVFFISSLFSSLVTASWCPYQRR